MKASTFNLHSIHQKTKTISSNRQIIILVALFFAGLIFGSFSVKSESSFVSERLVPFYMNYVRAKSTESSLAVFFSSLLMYSTVIIFAYFIGLCAVGIPFVALIPLCTGVFIGSVSGHIYGTYMLRGLGYCGIIIFPSAVIAISAIIFASKESMLMSRNMLNLLSQRHNQQYEDFKSYSIRFAIYIAISCGAALIDTVMTHLFIGLFNF